MMPGDDDRRFLNSSPRGIESPNDDGNGSCAQEHKEMSLAICMKLFLIFVLQN